MCAELGVPLVNLRESGFVQVSLRGERLKSVYLARPVLEADLVLNLPKLKTHSFTIFTGAVKNMYGVIPYGLRLEGHRRFLGRDSFSRMLVDIFSAVPRQLTLMDAVVGMEGEGPSAGYPKNVGLIISGADGVAVDAVASRLTGHDPLLVPTTANAQARGLGAGDLGSIDVVGERMEDVEARASALPDRLRLFSHSCRRLCMPMFPAGSSDARGRPGQVLRLSGVYQGLSGRNDRPGQREGPDR
jgi:uncharacterized protein (DUF362 family)